MGSGTLGPPRIFGLSGIFATSIVHEGLLSLWRIYIGCHHRREYISPPVGCPILPKVIPKWIVSPNQNQANFAIMTAINIAGDAAKEGEDER